jgi:membrane associated rhomboid family serine protease
VIPLRDVIPSRTTPVVTIALIGVNAVVFLVELFLPEPAREAFFRSYGVVPASLAMPAVVTSMFLHTGWLQWLGSIGYLWIFGDNVEDRLGHGRFLAFYLLCGTMATIAHVATHPRSTVPALGPGGAIAGVLGAYFVMFPRSRVLTLVPIVVSLDLIEIPAVFFLAFWLLLQVLSSLEPATAVLDAGPIALWAQVAGFAAGAAAVLLFRKPERQRAEWWT